MHHYSRFYRFGIHHVEGKLTEVFQEKGIYYTYQDFAGLRKIFEWGENTKFKLDIHFQFKKSEVILYYYIDTIEEVIVLYNPDLNDIVNTVERLIK